MARRSAEQDRGEDDHQDDDFAGDHLGAAEIERAAEQKARGERGLHGQALLIEPVAAEDGPVEPVGPRQNDQQQPEPGDIDEHHPLVVQVGVGEARADRWGYRRETQRQGGGERDGEQIERSPEKAGDRGAVEYPKPRRSATPKAIGRLRPETDYLLEIIRCRHGERLSHSHDAQIARRKVVCRKIPASCLSSLTVLRRLEQLVRGSPYGEPTKYANYSRVRETARLKAYSELLLGRRTPTDEMRLSEAME